jgi:hypothetical protein
VGNTRWFIATEILTPARRFSNCQSSILDLRRIVDAHGRHHERNPVSQDRVLGSMHEAMPRDRLDEF